MTINPSSSSEADIQRNAGSVANTTPKPCPVTQADRDAAAEMYRFVQTRIKHPHPPELLEKTLDQIKRGLWDKDESVQAFARHRIAALTLSPPSQEDVERVARAMAASDQSDSGSRAAWQDYVSLANAAIPALSRPPVEPIREGEVEHDGSPHDPDCGCVICRADAFIDAGIVPSSPVEPSLQARDVEATVAQLLNDIPGECFESIGERMFVRIDQVGKALRKALSLPASGRDEILEEAASIAEANADACPGYAMSGESIARRIAKSIRALKGQSLLAEGTDHEK
jgi:hypothetical protein